MTGGASGRGARDERLRRGRLVAGLMARALDARRDPVDLTSADLEAIQPLLVRSGAGPLAWWALRDTSLADDLHAQDLRDLFRMQALRVAIATSGLQMLVDACRARGVDPIVGKGWAVARWYPAQGLRPYGDFDLYAPSTDFATLVDVVKVLFPKLKTAVDLHRGASYLDDRDFTVLRSRSRLVPVGQTLARIYGPEDALRLACLHLLAEGAIRPPWLCDVAAILSKLPDEFDWDYFASGDPRRTEWAFVALGLAHDVLGADISRVPMRQPVRVRPAWIAESVFTLWGEAPPAKGNRQPVQAARRSLKALLLSFLQKWPNPIEATVGVGGRFSETPRLPYQIADAARRATKLFA